MFEMIFIYVQLTVNWIILSESSCFVPGNENITLNISDDD